MKKIVLTLFSAAALTASQPLTAASTVPMANFYKEGSQIRFSEDNSENYDLNELASSLGADTDYFDMINPLGDNYKISDEMLAKSRQTITQNEAMLNLSEYSGRSRDILQILVHNGIISPSDIQTGAETLKDIKLDQSVYDVLAYYGTLYHIPTAYYRNYYYCNTDSVQRMNDLIELAESSMKENKYFYIELADSKYRNHTSYCGIGIQKGEWQFDFDDTTYDKCILLLSSNLYKDNGDGTYSVEPFTPRNCMYISSDNKSFYIPANNSYDTLVFSIGDETFLNYKGLFSPSDEIITDTSDIVKIKTQDSHYPYFFNMSIEDNGVRRTFRSEENSDLDISQRDNLANVNEKHKVYYTKTSEDAVYKIDIEGFTDEQLDYYGIDNYYMAVHDFTLDLSSEKSLKRLTSQGKFTAEAGKNYVSITAAEKSPCKYDYENTFDFELSSEEGPYRDDPFCFYSVYGKFNKGTIGMTECEDGILISTDSYFEGIATFSGVSEERYSINIMASNDVLLKFDNQEKKIKIYIDKNGDGTFDDEVAKGDLNCDGVINSIDASYVLSAYANLSTGKILYLNNELADYNGDGAIDAVDATDILTYYAKQSTT